MAVTLTIEDSRRTLGRPVDTAVPDGSRVFVRRCADGADVLVLPEQGNLSVDELAEPVERRIQGISLKTINDDGEEVLTLRDTKGRDHCFAFARNGLSQFLNRAGPRPAMTEAARAPEVHRPSAPDLAPHEKESLARARRISAEAERVELEVAALRSRARANDRHVEAGLLSVEINAITATVSVCASDIFGGPELKIEIAAPRLVWLAEQLLSAKRGLDGAEKED